MSGPLHCRGVDFHCHLDLYPVMEAAALRRRRAEALGSTPLR